MWFKNLQIYRLSTPFTATPDQLAEKLAAQAFQPGTSIEMQRMGWVSPRNDESLVHAVAGQMMIALRVEKKLLPASVINQFAKARAQEIEEQQGYKPGRREMREIKDAVTNELLPRAFAIARDTRVWIDPVRNLIVVDAAASAKSDEVMQLLNESIENLGARPLQTALSPVSAMTSWLAADEAPAGFTVDQDTELRSSTQSKATVRYTRHALEAEDLRRHIEAGKQCTRLAMTWAERVSFTLTETLTLKRIAPLDMLTEKEDGSGDEAERFDSDFALMTGELGRLIDQLIETLGGEQMPK